MKEIAVAAGVAIVIGGLAWLIKSRVAEQHVVRLSDIPEVFERLGAQGTDGSFAVFMFRDRGRPGGEQVNLQFSIENGTVGS